MLALGAKVDPSRLMQDVKALSGSPRRTEKQRASARDYVVDQLKRAGVDAVSLPFSISDVAGVNLASPGCERPNVMLAAHYDTQDGTPGADDNASGVAVVLEVVRVLGTLPGLCVVFFDAEEPHGKAVGVDHRNYAYGSQALADSGVRPKLLIVVESVGFTCARPGCQQLPRGAKIPGAEAGDFVGLIGNSAGGKAWAALGTTFRSAVDRVVLFTVPGNGRTIPQSRFSDQAPFWDVDVPAWMITDTALLRNPNYHRPGDTADTLDAAFLERVARGVVMVTAHAAAVLEVR